MSERWRAERIVRADSNSMQEVERNKHVKERVQYSSSSAVVCCSQLHSHSHYHRSLIRSHCSLTTSAFSNAKLH